MLGLGRREAGDRKTDARPRKWQTNDRYGGRAETERRKRPYRAPKQTDVTPAFPLAPRDSHLLSSPAPGTERGTSRVNFKRGVKAETLVQACRAPLACSVCQPYRARPRPVVPYMFWRASASTTWQAYYGAIKSGVGWALDPGKQGAVNWQDRVAKDQRRTAVLHWGALGQDAAWADAARRLPADPTPRNAGRHQAPVLKLLRRLSLSHLPRAS